MAAALSWSCRRGLRLVCRLHLGGTARARQVQCGGRRLRLDPAKRLGRFSRRRSTRYVHSTIPPTKWIRNEFALFTSSSTADQGDIMRLIWVPRVTREERAAFEHAQRENGFPDFAIETWSLSNPPSVSPERDEYFPCSIRPLTPRRSRRSGWILSSELSAATRSSGLGNAMATAQDIQLRNPIGGQRRGFFAVLPVYRKEVPTGKVEERRENTLGVIVGAFQTAAVFDSSWTRRSCLRPSTSICTHPRRDPTVIGLYARSDGITRPRRAHASCLHSDRRWTGSTCRDGGWVLMGVPAAQLWHAEGIGPPVLSVNVSGVSSRAPLSLSARSRTSLSLDGASIRAISSSS